MRQPLLSPKHCAIALLLILGAAEAVQSIGSSRVAAQDQSPPAEQAPYAKLSKDQLERLVAPIALYAYALVAQVLAASTFPSQIVDAEQRLKQHPGLSASDLAAQIDKQTWDPSVKALVQFPSVLANLSMNIGWTSELGAESRAAIHVGGLGAQQ